ncbi:hypothetical protein ABPG77_002857 [Micractinium sp. CCAP 211/92]
MSLLRSPSSRLLRPSFLLGRALSCCAAEATAPAQPGSVSEYHQHVLLQLPRPEANGSSSSAEDSSGGTWWPPLIEKEPAVVAAFSAVAKNEDLIGGTVKITAFDDVPGGSGQPTSSAPPPGSCNLVAFPAGLRWEGLALDLVGSAVAMATAIDPQRLQLTQAQRKALNDRMVPVPSLSLFVCCHAARDARCGAAGPPLAAALQRLTRERGLAQHVQVFQTSHIGGHKYAGNVVVYGAMHPCDGDVFGGVTAACADAFLDAFMGVELGVDGGAGDPALRPFWRGRMGLSKLEQRDLFESGGAIEELLDVVSEDESYQEGELGADGARRARVNGTAHRQRGDAPSTPSMAEELREGVTKYED